MTDPARATASGGTALVVAGCVGLALACVLAFGGFDPQVLGPWFLVDATSRLFCVLINVIFLGVALHGWSRTSADPDRMLVPRRYVVLCIGLLVAANLSITSNHFIGSWVALECTTIFGAFLIVRADAPASTLAAWHYFLFSSIGLGLALLGFACIARGYASHGVGDLFITLAAAPNDAKTSVWFTLGIALTLLGYGAKLGLAPMYMWLPETYEEAPPPVTSLLATVQFNCALVGLLRVLQAFRPGHEQLVSTELVAMGIASVALASASLIATRTIRRLIAYASILHAGIIAVGLGVGAGAGYGVLLYAVSNAFIKAMLFLTAGKIEAQYHTRDTDQIRGVIKGLPYSGLFLMAGTFALLGFPPFGSFVGELLILSGLVRSGYLLVFATIGFLVTVTFVATGRTVFPMIWGEPVRPVDAYPQTVLSFLPKLMFLLALVVLGLHLPGPVDALFREVAVTLGDK